MQLCLFSLLSCLVSLHDFSVKPNFICIFVAFAIVIENVIFNTRSLKCKERVYGGNSNKYLEYSMFNAYLRAVREVLGFAVFEISKRLRFTFKI